MKLNEIYRVADELAPKRLSDEYCKTYGAYDNSGILVDTGKDVQKILFALDLTNAAVEKAIETKADLIITHHPMIYGKISDVRVDGVLGGKLVRCIQNGISVISMHLNLDVAKGGIDESLMDGVLRAAGERTGAGTNVSYEHALLDGAYGRAYGIPKIRLNELVENMKKEFSSARVLVYGDGNKKITRVASCCGAGGDESGVAFALRENADTLISADFKHHVLAMAQDTGLSVIVLTHYASENYGFEKYYEKIRRQVNIPCEYHTDMDLL